LDVAGQNSSLDGGADGNNLIGVDFDRRLTLKDVAHALDDYRRAGLAADEKHLGDVSRSEFGIRERLLAWIYGPFDEIHHEFFKLRPGEGSVEMLRSGRVSRYEREVELRLIGSRQLTLRALGGLLETLKSESIGVEIDACLQLERFDHPIDDTLVEVFTAQE